VAQGKNPVADKLDLDGVTARYDQALRAMATVMRATIEGMHDIALRQCEATSAMTKLSAELFAGASAVVDWRAGPGPEIARQAVETALGHALALVDITAKVQQETMTILGKSACESLSGLTALLPNGAERR